MNRLSLVAVCLSGALALGCGPKEFGSVCSEVPAPAECMTTCNPSPGAATTCPSGFHCSPDGLCDAQCTVGGGQCGAGYMCTTDGYCVDDGSGSGEPPGPDAACPAVNFTPMPTTPSIGLVLDQSGSMFTNNLGSVTRYAAMQDALIGTNGVVTQLQAKAYFGHNQYTCTSNDNNSSLSLKTTPRALNNAGAISAQLAAGVPGNSFNTPTHAAINAMVAAFAAQPAPAGSPPVIVLATDGVPNSCGTGPGANGGESQTVAAAAAAHAAGIPVYVLAINTGTSTHFQDVANAGQGSTSNVTYYPVTNAAGLQAAFQTIINGVISCDLSLTSSIDATQAMNGTLTINGVTLTYGTDWVLVGGNVIRVQGAACNTLKASANPVVQATFPCGSVIF
ncbi:MAG: VWA domain-containing protein [Deltaproteobacteria bacterium]|nr:VWA domain-containing protein [Deltaproteobacteria bacterium]